MVTVPAATWLWQQGPKKSSHGDHHGHVEHGENEEQEASAGEDGKEEPQEDSEGVAPSDNEQAKGDSGNEGSEDGGEEGSDQNAEKEEDKRPLGERVRNEPPNEITSTENKFTSGDEGLKEGSDDTLHKKSQQMKSIDPDADEGNEDGPRDDVDKGHEGEQKGTRVTGQDQKRKVSDTLPALFPAIEDVLLF